MLYGIFEAAAPPALSIEPDAWTAPWPRSPSDPPPAAATPLPAQVRVKIATFCDNSLPLERFRSLLTPRGLGSNASAGGVENGGAGGGGGGLMFDPELSLSETQALISAFIAYMDEVGGEDVPPQ